MNNTIKSTSLSSTTTSIIYWIEDKDIEYIGGKESDISGKGFAENANEIIPTGSATSDTIYPEAFYDRKSKY